MFSCLVLCSSCTDALAEDVNAPSTHSKISNLFFIVIANTKLQQDSADKMAEFLPNHPNKSSNHILLSRLSVYIINITTGPVNSYGTLCND